MRHAPFTAGTAWPAKATNMVWFYRTIVSLGAAAVLVAASPAAARRQTPAQQAQALAASGKTDEAMALLQAALAKRPKDAALHNALGALLNQNGRYGQALYHAEQAARLRPREARYRYNRGIVLAELGRFEEAVGDFDFAIGKLPREAPMYLERGAARLSLGMASEARSDWMIARRLDPRLVWTDWYEGLHDLIDGNNGLAIRKFSTVALLQPSFGNAQLWLAAAHLLAGMPYRPKPVADAWVSRLVDYHSGTLTFAQLMTVANSDTQSGDRRRVGEAWLHHGLKLQRDGLLAEAKVAFAESARTQAPRHAWKLLAEKQLARP